MVCQYMPKRFSWILWAVLPILVMACILSGKDFREKDKLVGTFSTGSGISSDELYVVFFSGNKFLIYRQSSDILNGTFNIKAVEGNLVAEMISDGESAYVAIYDKRDSLVLVGVNEPVRVYELTKLSDVPIVIGHQFDYSNNFKAT